jgi:2-dehydro-3-deoxygluconokinase
MTNEMKIASIGECMIEICARPDNGMALAYGGDTLNTAVYLARLGRAGDGNSGVKVDYLTALGNDPYSDEMLAFWQAEGIGTDRIPRLPGRLPGLYTIRTDEGGERSFHYWRSASAARELMQGENAKHITAALVEYDLVYLSGITLSILPVSDRAKLFGAVDHAVAKGARIAFDCNYRARGWPDEIAARRAMDQMYRRSHIALPSLDDECALHGDMTPEVAAQRIADLGAKEVCLKLGDGGCLVLTDGKAELIPAVDGIDVADTTAAGDSFNAAYIYQRLIGADTATAAQAGHQLAAQVIQHPGAVIPVDKMP